MRGNPAPTDLHVHRSPKGWAVRRHGARRAWKVVDERGVAVRIARERAERNGVRVVVHTSSGTVDWVEQPGGYAQLVPRSPGSRAGEIEATLERLAEETRGGEVLALAVVIVRPGGAISTLWERAPVAGFSTDLIAGAGILHQRLILDVLADSK